MSGEEPATQRAPRNQGNRNGDAGYRSRDNTRRTILVETSDALVGLTQSNASVEMPRVESVRPSRVIIEDWVSDDEDIFQSNDLQATDKPSLKRIEFTNARNESGSLDQFEQHSKNKINQNTFVPSAVLTRFGREPVSAAKPSSLEQHPATKISNEKVNTVRVNGVNTARQIAVSAVTGNEVTDVKDLASCVWRPKMTNLNNVSKDNSGSWVSKRVNYIDP
ncbi:hypothetical protein Tco_0555664 [Tanacetum coccineum]